MICILREMDEHLHMLAGDQCMQMSRQTSSARAQIAAFYDVGVTDTTPAT